MEKMNFVGDVFTDSGEVVPVLPVVKLTDGHMMDDYFTEFTLQTVPTMREFRKGDEVLLVETGEYTKALVLEHTGGDEFWEKVRVRLRA